MPLTTQAATRKDLSTGLSEMQHRHFATVATIIRGLPEHMNKTRIAEHFACELAKTNPRFDRERFMRATQAE